MLPRPPFWKFQNQNNILRNETLSTEIESLKVKIEVINVKHLTTDAILIGIPTLPEEDLKITFNTMCHTLDYQLPKLCRIFRASHREDSIIIVKFFTAHDKNTTLKAFADFRKKNSRHLMLSDIGEESNTPIYFHESLTKNNRAILRQAIHLRRKHDLFSVFTANGLVYIKLTSNEEPLTVNTVDAINSIVNNRKQKNNRVLS